jgi:heat shock protein HslJ
MMQALTPKVLAAIAALAVSSTAAYAAPAAPAAKSVPVKMSDQKLDRVAAGTGAPAPRVTTVVCSFGNNCSGNGGSNNGNSKGFINVANGTLAGSAILSGNAIYVW